MSTTPSSETESVERVARQYRKEGYEVTISPPSSDLPPSLQDFQIDLIARRAGETVIVEVKAARTDKARQEVQRLADLVNNLPNFRVDFVAVQRNAAPDREEWLGAAALTERIEEAMQAFRQRRSAIAVMALWSATEGTLRLLAKKAHLTLSSRGPQTMVKTLYSQGAIEKWEYEILEEAGRLRNSAVHGFRLPIIDLNRMEQWRRIVLDVLRRAQR